jgi:Domain of unknown function (DUF4252)
MKSVCAAAFALSAIVGINLAGGSALAQTPQDPPPASAQPASAVVLDWAPPALAALSAQAAAKSSFTLDRTMLTAAAGLTGDIDDATRQAIAKLDGVSVHVLRFADTGVADPAQIAAIRDAYHQRGWKHVVTTTSGESPLHDATTDVWVVMDGTNLRGAVVLVQSAKTLTLATVKGNLSPTDLLHLRGHFGIPRFDGDGLASEK